jgi:hypothetical protein
VTDDRCPNPKCAARLVGVPLRCTRCKWHLVTVDEWRELSPFEQGYTHYMQASWPTSPLKAMKNHYASGSTAWKAFQDGAHRAALEAQDGEE